MRNRLVVCLSVASAVLTGCTVGATSPLPVASLDRSEPSVSVRPSYRAMNTPRPTPVGGPLRYVALGDSYTIGTRVRPRDRWPNVLVRELRPEFGLTLVDNLGVEGYTTKDVMEHELPALEDLHPQFSSLLIGVNDAIAGVTPDQYRTNVRAIFEELLKRMPADRILVVSTPDYTLTKAGQTGTYGAPDEMREKINDLNLVLQEEAESLGLTYVDISQIADKVVTDPDLVADDGLHPSAKQYGAWADTITPYVRSMLAQPDP